MNEFLSENRRDTKGGETLQVDIMRKTTGAASMVGPADTELPNIEQVMTKANFHWCGTKTYWGITDFEMDVNQAAAKRIDLVRVQRIAALMSLSDLLEEQFWGLPQTSAFDTNNKGLLGPLFHFPSILTAQVSAAGGTSAITGAFQGGNPVAADNVTFSGWGGIDKTATVNARAKTFNAGWETSSGFSTGKDLEEIDNAFLDLDIEAPEQLNLPDGGTDWRVYTGKTNIRNGIKMRRSQDTKLGPDLGEHGGTVVYNNIPWRNTPPLDIHTNLAGTTSYPMMFINLRWFKLFGLANGELKEMAPMRSVFQPQQMISFIYAYLQSVLLHPQRGGGQISYVA
jgi:hypothetical protein